MISFVGGADVVDVVLGVWGLTVNFGTSARFLGVSATNRRGSGFSIAGYSPDGLKM